LKTASIIWTRRAIWAFALLLTVQAANAWAGNEFAFTRETYDLMMRWVNFLILAFLIIKYARRPIANFLTEKKGEVAATIERLEAQKQDAKVNLLECQRRLTTSLDRMEGIKSKIVAEGEGRKAQLIAEAQKESRIMMETAQFRISHMVHEARSRLKSELIDTAAELAATKLPGMLTDEDQDRLVRKWMAAARE
jgi:F-type H+-transporting ATPase subunit b